MSKFLTWLNNELNREGWSINELSRRSGLSNSALYATINGRNAVTWDFCFAVAKPFRKSPEELFRMAGLLPEGENIQPLIDQAKLLNPSNLELLIDLAQFLHKRQEG